MIKEILLKALDCAKLISSNEINIKHEYVKFWIQDDQVISFDYSIGLCFCVFEIATKTSLFKLHIDKIEGIALFGNQNYLTVLK